MLLQLLHWVLIPVGPVYNLDLVISVFISVTPFFKITSTTSITSRVFRHMLWKDISLFVLLLILYPMWFSIKKIAWTLHCMSSATFSVLRSISYKNWTCFIKLDQNWLHLSINYFDSDVGCGTPSPNALFISLTFLT